MDQFIQPIPKQIQLWWDYKSKFSMFLGGLAGMGKTALILAMFETLGKPALIISNVEQLKDINNDWDKYSGIIFDDCQLNKQTPEQFIALFDLEQPRCLGVKHGHVTIPAFYPRVITSNLPLEKWIPPWVQYTQKQALMRRCISDFITKRLFNIEEGVTNDILPHNIRHPVIDLTGLGFSEDDEKEEEDVFIADSRNNNILTKTSRRRLRRKRI